MCVWVPSAPGNPRVLAGTHQVPVGSALQKYYLYAPPPRRDPGFAGGRGQHCLGARGERISNTARGRGPAMAATGGGSARLKFGA